MTAGGKKLGMSKALVSRTISGLEDRLKVRLLNRSTRRISLTEAGSVYLDHCHAVLERNDAAEARLAEVSQTVSGMLRINAPIDYGNRTLAPLLPRFLDRHPDLQIEIELTDSFVDLIEEGVDLLIRIGTTLPESAIARKFGETTLHLVASEQLIERRGQPASLSELLDWPRIVYPPRPGPSGLERVRHDAVLRSNNGEVLLAMAEAGLGYCYLPEFLIREAVEKGTLRTLLDDSTTPETLPIHALWPHRKHMSLKTRAFVDYLVEAVGK